nr:hypothetical protein Iba_chr12cCG14030 [Ipomoea batatas]
MDGFNAATRGCELFDLGNAEEGGIPWETRSRIGITGEERLDRAVRVDGVVFVLMLCYLTVRYQVELMENLTDYIVPSCGLRQGSSEESDVTGEFRTIGVRTKFGYQPWLPDELSTCILSPITSDHDEKPAGSVRFNTLDSTSATRSLNHWPGITGSAGCVANTARWIVNGFVNLFEEVLLEDLIVTGFAAVCVTCKVSTRTSLKLSIVSYFRRSSSIKLASPYVARVLLILNLVS